VSKRREVGRRVLGSDAAFVVAEHHVHHPVQAGHVKSIMEKNYLNLNTDLVARVLETWEQL
jgi:hypothetical protein